MKHLYKSLLLFFFLFPAHSVLGQCPVCSATTIYVDLSSVTDTAYTYSSVRSGNCCSGSNCIKFIVILNPNADLVNFDVTNPSPSGSAYYQINCDSPAVSIGTPACITGSNDTICITYCKPGGDKPTYHITQTRTVSATKAVSVRVGCTAPMTVFGLNAASVVWTSISPGAPGTYNSYLSCTSGCTTTNVTPTSSTPSIIQYQVSGSPLTSCPGTALDTVTVYIYPAMKDTVLPSNPVICSGGPGNVILTDSAWGGGPPYSYTWSNGATTQSITVTSAGTYKVSVMDTVSHCSPVTDSVVVKAVTTPSAPTAGSNSPVCAGTTLNLTATNIAGATYNWTGPNGFSSSSQNPSISNVTVADAGTYSVTATVDGCTGPAGTTTVIINPQPTAPTMGSNSPICAGTTLNLTTPFVAGATYNWTGPNGFSSSLQNPSISNATVAASGTYYLTITVGGCASPMDSISVTVNPAPATPTASSNSPLCSGSTLNLTTPTVAGAAYNWTGPNSFSSSSQNPSISNVTPSDAGAYILTITVAGCTSKPDTVMVVIDTTAIVSAGINQTVCANNDSVHLNGTSSTGSGKWTTSGSGTFSPNNTTLNAVYIPSNADTTAGTVTLTLTSTNNGACGASVSTIVITITHAPTAEAGPNQTVCANNANVTLNGSYTVASGGIWTTTGTGSFSPNNTTMNATYTPSNADTAAGSVKIILTTTGNGTCKAATDTMIITYTNAPTVNAGKGDTVCTNNPDVSLNGSSSTGKGKWATSGSGTFSPNDSTLSTTYVPSGADILAGTVTLTLTSTGNGNCLPVSQSIVITITPPPVVSAGTDVTVCANNDSIKLSGTSSTGSGHWTTSGSGTFSPNSNTLNATYVPSNADTTAGTVTLTLTSTKNGNCLAVSDQITITFTHAPTAEAGPNQTVCANNATVTLNGSFTVAGGGIWSTSGTGTFLPNNTTMNATYIPSNADTAGGSVMIILTTTGNGTCKAVTDTMFITYTHAPSVNAGKDTTICLSSPNYTLNGYSSTGSGTWTTLGSGTFSPNNNTLTATYIPSTADTTAKTVTLILTSTNNGGCNAVSDTIVLKYSSVPTADAGNDQTVCANNDVISLNATSSTGTGKWTTSGSGTFSPNNTTLNATYIPSNADTAAGTVTLTFTTTGGCVPVSKSITITITHAPYVNAGPNLFACKNNPNVTLSGKIGGGATTGKWTTSGSGTFSPNDSDLNATYIPSNADTTAGSVILILTSTNNGYCLPVSDTIKVTYTAPPVANAGMDLTGCANNSVPLSGIISGGSGTGKWTTTNGTGTFSPNDTTLNCSYIPSNADTLVGNIILVLTSTNNGGCLASSDTMIIKVVPGPIVNAGPNQTLCKNNNIVTLSGTITHASGGKWTTMGSGTFSPNDTNLSTTYVPGSADTAAGSVTIILTSTGNGVCQPASDTMVVTFSPAPDVNAGSTIYICTGATTASLNGTISGGSSTGKWTTLGSGTFSPNDSTLNATYNLSNADTTAGTVTLILTSTNNGTCNPSSDTVVIKITPVPSVYAGNDTSVCANNANITLNGIVNGGSGTGVWTTTGTGTFTPSDSVLNATYDASATDTTAKTVTLVLSATNACKPASDTMVVTFTPAPVVNPGTNLVICAGDKVNLNGGVTIASGGKWTTSGNGTFVPNDSDLNATYIPGSADTAAGTVTLVLTTTGNKGCLPVSDSIVITIQTKPVANFSSSPACVNTAINFTDISTISKGTINSWWWNFGNGTSTIQNPTNTFTTTGLQIVTLAVSSSAGCADTITKTIYVNPLPTAAYTKGSFCPDSAQFTDKSSISPGNIKSWLWSFGDSTSSNLQDPSHTFPTPGTYSVTLVITSDSGCTGTYSDTITVNDCNNNVGAPAVPSAFTPNGDGNNDILYVKGGPFSQMDFRVFNEWGNQIFRSTDQSIGWDGTLKEKKQPAGTYVWILTGTTTDGTSVKMKGDVTLLR